MVAVGRAPASGAWVIVNQPDGLTTKVWPVTVGGQKLFAFQLVIGPNPLSWRLTTTRGTWSGGRPPDPGALVAGIDSRAGRGRATVHGMEDGHQVELARNYARGEERDRLDGRAGRLEFARTTEIVPRRLRPRPP